MKDIFLFFTTEETGMDAAKWVALVVAVLGVALFFTDLILNIKKRHNTRMNIIGLVFLSLSLVCFVLTQFVFSESSAVFNLLWIPFLVGYFVCDVIVAVCIGKENLAKKRSEKSEDVPSEGSDE